MVFVPMPAVEGVKVLVPEFTPGPEYVPPNGIPPLSMKGVAETMVILSKQRVKKTAGAGRVVITILFDEAGLFAGQMKFEVSTQLILSPD